MLFQAGPAASAELDKDPTLEAKEKSVVDRAAEIVAEWWADSYFKRISAKLESRGHKPFDPGPQHEPDFGERLRKIEGRLGRDYPEVHIQHTEGGGKNSWKDWILIIVGTLIVAWLGRLDSKMDDISDLKAEQRVLQKHQEEVDKHLESTDGRVNRVENKVYRGSP